MRCEAQFLVESGRAVSAEIYVCDAAGALLATLVPGQKARSSSTGRLGSVFHDLVGLRGAHREP